MTSRLDPDWPPRWKHARHDIPFASYWPLWLRCKDCGAIFCGTNRTASRVTRYRDHWLRTHAEEPHEH